MRTLKSQYQSSVLPPPIKNVLLFILPLEWLSDCNMGLKLQCSDLKHELNVEATCPYVARGENMEALTEDLWNHAKEVHGSTDEQLLSPKVTDAVKAAIQKE